MPPLETPADAMPPASLENRVSRLGEELRATLLAVLDSLPDGGQGPQGLARALGLDKVLTSRLLKASRCLDPIAVAHSLPGPDPMRRFFRAARRRGGDRAAIAVGERAIDAFQTLIRDEIGDRSSLDAMIAAWLPEARAEFELRRKQAAFKAMSQLRGVSATTNLGTVFLHPATEPGRIDVVWIVGLLGIRRWRPGVRVKLATRRIAPRNGDRHPQTLAGENVTDIAGLRLDRFCDAQPAALDVRQAGDTVHYLLAGEAVGRKAVCDLLLAEVNRAEIPDTPEPGRKGYVFAEVSTPCRSLLFDVLVHADVYRGAVPELAIYDTSFDGVVDVNDPARVLDRLDMNEQLQHTGRGIGALRAPDVPNHRELLRHVFASTGWDSESFDSWRCRIDYPLLGSQVTVAFDPPRT